MTSPSARLQRLYQEYFVFIFIQREEVEMHPPSFFTLIDSEEIYAMWHLQQYESAITCLIVMS